ncbi:MAG: leucyl aminopeptidase [Phycisphaerae bacterium]|nr:leucyl aminopeptidase [Phycisphaerae bacterium]
MNPHGTVFGFKSGDKGPLAGEVLLVPLLAKPQPPMELVARIDKLCGDAVSELLAVKAVREEVGHLSHTTRSGPCRRVLLVSLGAAEKVAAHEIRNAAAATARWLTAERLTSATLWIDGLATSGVDQATAEWAIGLALAGFRFTGYKERDEKVPTRVQVYVRSSESGHVARVRPEIRAALTVAEAVNYTRRLAHEPGNVINPATLAAEARKLARAAKLKCTVFTADRLKQMGMNGLLAVGQGARYPSCLIQLEYRGAPRARATTVLVGKGITFDTGGYSIKPSSGLDGMKFDMSGGATVLGVLKAAAALKLECNLIGLIAAAENAVSDKSYRPGDILKMMSGKTVEVINTDAEGRLVLADALWYAQQKLKPSALIDVATLTGGVGVALGTAAAGIMSNDDALAGDLGEAGRRTHERLWRLPLWDDYKELLKSTEADIKNAGGKRDAHCIAGGMFLKEFVKKGTPWAHLDIAAVANPENGKGPTGKGASGFGVRLLIEFLRFRGA